MSRSEFWSQLGLEYSAEPQTLELGRGIRLTFRPPTSHDTTRARHANAIVFAADDEMRTAAQRYAWSSEDVKAVQRPSNWEGIGQLIFCIELAALTVTSVQRFDGDCYVGSVPVSIATFSELFRLDDNLETFAAAVDKSAREMLRAKKEPASSLNGCSPEEAPTVMVVDGSGDPAPTEDSSPKTDNLVLNEPTDPSIPQS